MAEVTVRDLGPADHDWARALITGFQGSPRVARLGELIDPLTLEGMVAERDGSPVGLASIIETPENGLEILLLQAEPSGTAPARRCWRPPARWRRPAGTIGSGW